MESDPPFQENYKTLLAKFMEEEEANPQTQRVCLKNPFTVTATDDKYELPLVDLSRLSLSSDHDRKECEREVARAANEWGFFQVVNHGVSREILARLRCEQEKLFRQPFRMKADGKFLNLSKECYRWGTPAATSLMQLSWSEAFHIPLNNVSALKPEFNTTLSTTISEFAEQVFELAQRIAEILAESLGSRATFFARNCQPSSCYLRMNRYPPCPVSFSEIYGLVPHTDSDFLTVLYQDQVGGLQIVKDGKWVGIKPNPEALIINIGDLFQAWSNDVYKSIEHRVISNHEGERFSVGYFFCPSNDIVIQGYNEPSMYKKFSFREYRHQVQEDVKSTGSKVGLRKFLV